MCESAICKEYGEGNCQNWDDFGIGKDRASWGEYMLKIGTIQTYRKELSNIEVINLAMNEPEARKLASEIIFGDKETEGIRRWRNCMEKYGLLQRVNFIKNLEAKTK